MAQTCLVLVCGLPGAGKSSFCAELIRRGSGDVEWLHFCYDAVERAMREHAGTFTPQVWQEARAKVAKDVESLLGTESRRRVILLDDNMYYRSMRCSQAGQCLEHLPIHNKLSTRGLRKAVVPPLPRQSLRVSSSLPRGAEGCVPGTESKPGSTSASAGLLHRAHGGGL